MREYSRLTSEQKYLIIMMYDNGYNTVEIQNAIHKDNSSIGLFLKKCGYAVSQNIHRIKISEDDVHSMCWMYASKISFLNIGKYYGVSENTVKTLLANQRIFVRMAGEAHKKIKNDSYFENIDTERKAYFLGLIVADGCIIENYTRKHAKSLSLTLNEADSYLIKELERDLGVERIVLHKAKGKSTTEWRGASKNIINDLERYGVVPRKTFKTYMPVLRADLYQHFIRGYFDGNGTVYYNNKSKHITFGFYGTNKILSDIRNILISNEVNLSNKAHIFDKPTVSMLYYSKKSDVQSFYNYIYSNATIWMKRKREKFESQAKTA